jgi:alpha-galactosidase
VWRGQTFQAENAVIGHGVAIIACDPGVCSNGSRVGYIGPHSTVTFNHVLSTRRGPRVLIVYYANGDACGSTPCARYFNISVNGGPPQPWPFPVVKGGDWNLIGSQPILLTGFVQGATNTITFTGDLAHPAPDLDWIEVE